MPAMGCCELIDVFPASVLCRACARRPAEWGQIGNRKFVLFELMGLEKVENICHREFGRDGK
jgi:hypothetical protein